MMAFPLFGQQKVWVFLSDKGNCVEEQLQQPENFLSAEAIENRKLHGISIDESDLPVVSAYVEQLKMHSHQVVGTSRWLNAVAVELTPDCVEEVEALDFVTGLRPMQSLVKSSATAEEDSGPIESAWPRYIDTKAPFDYGEATLQNNMLNIAPLHERGITGRGVRIALFDAGFSGADTIDVFDSLWTNKRIGGYYDYFDDEDKVFEDHSHGTQVMSVIGANLPGEMVGMAPHATFFMFRTEDGRTETKKDEYTWVKALEAVDSLGIQIVHSSLGYSEFDNPADDYTYEEMDGNTAVITVAADRAAAKGIIICTSAGNEGAGSWRYITAPCDGDSVICVGSVNQYENLSRFSSVGPSADGRIKPDVVALGSRTTVASPRNYITRSDGTSFSGPLVAGLLVCLRQAHPDRSNMDIIQAVKLSGDQYAFPDNEFGYGVPNAVIADSLLTHVKDLSRVTRDDITEKPARGGQKKPTVSKTTEKPQGDKIVFAKNPQSNVMVSGGKLQLTTPSAIRDAYIMRGKQKVLLNPKLVEMGDKTAVFDLSGLLDGDHYIYIKTTQYQENVRFQR